MTSGKQQERGHLEYRRLSWIMIAGAVMWLVLIVRLVHVQGLQHAEYAVRGKRAACAQGRAEGDPRRGFRPQWPRVGHGYSSCKPSMPILKWLSSLTQVAKYFASIGSQRVETIARQLNSRRRFVYLARQVVDETVLEQIRRHSFSGVFEYPETKRYYPYGSLAGQLLGHTDIDNRGSEGIEGAFDKVLGGTNGMALTYVDSWGRQVPGMQQERKPPQNGQNLFLTLDAIYQTILEEELERAIQKSDAESGMGIISDPRTGEILALANVPQYDPNMPGRTPAKLRRNRALNRPL